MKKKFTGIFPALVTPFDGDGNLNTKAVPDLVEAGIRKGVSGFYVGGSTGESYLLTSEERKRFLEAVMEAVDGRVDVIANIGVFSTREGIALARHAEGLGVSAISSVPPFYFPFTTEEYVEYYGDLADSVDVPVILYNIPAMSGVGFGMEEIDRFFANEKIGGMKHTSYDLFQLEQILRKYPEKSIFCGHDELFLSAVAVGVQAGIGSTYNIMAEKFVQIRQLAEKNDWDGARRLQAEINDVVAVLCRVGVFKGVKAILKMQGIDCGECRKPFQPLTAEQLEELRMMAVKNRLL